ncbi:helix-turn-helix domain-containing protein [Variovorax ginsengisoli]|uniref:AraC family transcriptional regulator ligand-binding domain-containing protein n=1 Tax=Variovorax ginsengisoli TaxID=363844 RepID=A0ABT8SA02_9BURK|nr:AraC family transcriptional regulator [Variovorax ginsengisoli]MDN8616443.1 AraC family transcriptional regulator ligand-binding domain-containing protein [Variovorax ginsengisoli]MDO1535613.1 AraC family transcriptional regulator ligand-binding domain-containing protein [Variovorax ginsengisoli]
MTTVAFAHPVYVRTIVDCLNGRGVDSVTLLTDAGLSWQDLSNDLGMIDLLAFRQFAYRAIQRSGESSLGYLAGSMLQPYHTPVGIAAVSGGSVREGLDFLSAHADLLFPTFDFQVQHGPTSSTLRIRPLGPMCDAHVFALHSILGWSLHLLKAMIGNSPDEVVVGLPYPQPSGHDVSSSLFAKKLVFDQACLMLQLPVGMIDRRCLFADQEAFKNAAQDCLRQRSEFGFGAFAERVRRSLLKQLAHNPVAAVVASDLGVSPRRLARRLAQSGASFSGIKDEVRKSQAAWYLQHTDLSIETIASHLGYADPTNFGRKFKCWYLVAPSRMRQEFKGVQHP